MIILDNQWLIFLLVATSLLAPSIDAATRKNFTSLSEALTDAEQYILKVKNASNVPAITFGLSVKGKTVFAKAFGFSDLENGVFAKITTRFRLASLSKSFTSALIGSLVDQGLVHYNESVHNYLKESDFPKKEWKGKPVTITIGQLLSHTAGTVSNNDDYSDDIVKAHDVTECIHKLKGTPLIFAPGTGFSYSNYGFQLLGAVIESVTKKPYDVAMHQFIHEHRLKSTVVETLHSELIMDRARYYRPANESAPRVNIPSPISDEVYMVEAQWSDGNVVSNVVEMLQYGNLLINSYKGRKPALVSQNTINTMWTSHTGGLVDLENRRETASYGYAWFVYSDLVKEKLPFEVKHHKYVSHDGSAAGLATQMNIYPEEEIVAVALCNKGGTSGLNEAIAYTVENVSGLV